jgi:PAS domain S-box-containing protein
VLPGAAEREHGVFFYENERTLFDRIGAFIAEGFEESASVLVVATPEHWRGFRRALEARGIDVETAALHGTLVSMNARETLDSLMSDGALDATRFDTNVGEVVRRLSGRVRIYGEMVDLLCRDGRSDAALTLEELWNDLCDECDITLFCAYDMSCFVKDEGRLFRSVCASHDRAHPAASPTESFRLLVESVRDYAIFMLDPRGVVRTWNAGAERIKGYRADEIIGTHFSAFYTRPDADSGKCEHELEAATAEGRFEDEGWRVRKDGTTFWANVVITALHNPNGELVGFAKVTRDLSERKRAEEERIRLARAEEANRVKDEFLATFSHELRTPLNSILGWAKLLISHGTDPYVAKGLATIVRNAQAQARLVEDLLDISRVVSGKLDIELGAVDFATIVRDAVDSVRPAAQAKGLTVDFRPYGSSVRLIGDATRLVQVVSNILTNAVKFTDRGGTVHVTLDVTGGATARLRIQDTGRGIDPTFLPHVFERFRQDDTSAGRRVGGLGLGLAIVHHLVTLHGGSVLAESEGRDRGATFTIMLPVERPPAAVSEVTKKAAARLEGIHVLIVEDELDSRELVTMILEKHGANVTAVESVRLARDVLARKRFDVILSDVGMPGEDGYSFVKSLRGQPRDRGGEIPVIALTAYAGAQERQRALDAGFVNHISKPVHPDEIASVVRNVAALGRSATDA